MGVMVAQGATGDVRADGLLSGSKWSGVVTIGYPDQVSDFPAGYGSEPTQGFYPVSSYEQEVIRHLLGLVEGYTTNISFQYVGAQTADISIAQSSQPVTAHAMYPGAGRGGDIWFGSDIAFRTPLVGDYAYHTHLHELGHALGLQHGHATAGPAGQSLPKQYDYLAYSVMSYRGYINASTTAGYTNERYGYPTTFMPSDILALQYMYGADYSTNAGNTKYTWDPTTGQMFIDGKGQPIPGGSSSGVTSTNRIFHSIWDGGGVDTYDLSNYTTSVSLYLGEGEASGFSTTQSAQLGNGQRAGNIYNAFMFGGNTASLIDNALGGSAADNLRGNQLDNYLGGNGGNDKLYGWGGNDALVGGAGNDTISGGMGVDTAVYDINYADAFIAHHKGSVFSVYSAATGLDTLGDVEYVLFRDRTVDLTKLRTADTTGPRLLAVNPQDNRRESQGDTYQSISMSFDEIVTAGTGQVRIYYSDGVLFKAFDVRDAIISDNGPGNGVSVGFLEATWANIISGPGRYYIEVDPGAFVDGSGNPFAGISGSTTWNFAFGVADDYPEKGGVQQRLTLGGPAIKGYVGSDDIDGFTISVVKDQLYEIILQPTGAEGALGAYAYLETNEFYPTSIASGDVSRPLAFKAPATTTYYLYVRNDSLISGGDYTLEARTATDDFAGDTTTAGVLTTGVRTTGRLNYAGDVDYFKFTVVAGQTYRFTVEDGPRTSIYRQAAELRPQLWSSNGALLGSADDLVASHIVYTATANGTVYLAVQTQLSSVNAATYGVLVEAGALTAPRLTSFSPATGATNVHPGANIVITYDAAVRAGVGVFTLTGTNARHTIDVTDASQVSISGNVVTINPARDLPQGTYTLSFDASVVRGANGTNAGSGTGETLSFTVADYAASTATVGVLTINGPKITAASVDSGDWFKVTLTAGVTYDFRMIGVDGASTSGLSNTDLSIRNSTGTVLARDTDTALGLASKLTYTALTSGTHFLEAKGSGASGYYTLDAVTVGPALPDAVATSFLNILRAPAAASAVVSMAETMATKLTSGALNTAGAVRELVQAADATTSVATLAYQFFTGKIPSAAGMDYLVSPTGPNGNNLNSTYFQSFSLENRYINFAVNLGRDGEGKAAFLAAYGSLSLAAATKKAYGVIFGATPTDAKVAALLAGGRDLYFESYGKDGVNGQGTKAAMVGWLLAEAVKADLGMYARANDAFLTDLADGATFAVDLIGVYGRPEFNFGG